MIPTIVLVTVLGTLFGVGWKYLTDRSGNTKFQITWPEVIVGSLATLIALAPLTTWIGFKMAINSQVTFYENRGGVEVRARIVKHKCSRDDGTSKHTWQGDPYIVHHPATYDSKGKVVTPAWDETKYHTIPYSSEEWDYVIDTTLGEEVIASRNFPPNPQNYRYRFLVAVPNIPSETGAPLFWEQAKHRIEVLQDPGSVTKRYDYENYILAVHDNILREHSSNIARLKQDGLLPDLQVKIRPQYYCDRVYGVGFPVDFRWQESINRFNAAFGAELQGDLHLVIVDANKVGSADDYCLALIAYWLSEDFGHNAFAKNGVLVVLGTKDGKTVDWARADYGMPMGNEALSIDIRNKMPGTKLEPDEVLGKPVAVIHGDTATFNHTKGALEQIVYGQNKFQRVHMKQDGGYTYLLAQVKPTGWQKFFIILVGVLVTGVIWFIMYKVELPIYFDDKSGN